MTQNHEALTCCSRTDRCRFVESNLVVDADDGKAEPLLDGMEIHESRSNI